MLLMTLRERLLTALLLAVFSFASYPAELVLEPGEQAALACPDGEASVDAGVFACTAAGGSGGTADGGGSGGDTADAGGDSGGDTGGGSGGTGGGETGPLAVSSRLAAEGAGYVMGWASGLHVVLPSGDDCLLFAFGHATAGDANNSGRCVDPVSGTVDYLWPDTETKSGIPADGAPYDRDNHAFLRLPAADGSDAYVVVFGGDSSSGGAYSLVEGRWTQRWSSVEEYGDGLISGWTFGKPFNAAQACSRVLKKCVLFAGKANSVSNDMIVIEPTPDGPLPYAAHPVSVGGPGWNNIRDAAAIVGDWLYVYSGWQSDGEWSTALRRFNLATEAGGWESLPNGPSAGGFTVMTHDPVANVLVVYGGGKSNRVLVYDLTAGAWSDLTAEAGMPYVRLHAGAYYPPSGEHCYRGGVYYTADGSQRHWSTTEEVWCLKVERAGTAGTGDGTAGDTTGDTSGDSADDTADADPTDGGGDAGAGAALPVRVVAMPDGEADRSWGKAPSSSIKHTVWAENPQTGCLVSMGGDFGGPPARMSYRQDNWEYCLAANTWRLGSPYCVGADEVAPRHPDVSGWRWDAKREGFWYAPGLLNPSDGEFCDAGTYPRRKVMFWDPESGKWSVPEQGTYPDRDTGIDLGAGHIRHAAYLPGEDALFKIGSSQVAILDIEAGRWDVHGYEKGPNVGSRARIKFTEPRVHGRDVYLNLDGELVAYNLDDDVMRHVRDLPSGLSQMTQQDGPWLIWPPSVYASPVMRDLVAYNVETGELRRALLRDPQIMEDAYGTTFGYSATRHELFWYGKNTSWSDWYGKFYVFDLSGLLAHQ